MQPLAPRSQIAALTEFRGVTVNVQAYRTFSAAYEEAARLAEMLNEAAQVQRFDDLAKATVGAAAAAANRGANAILQGVMAKCTNAPPPVAISMVPDANGRLILQCAHRDDPHRWDLAGNPI